MRLAARAQRHASQRAVVMAAVEVLVWAHYAGHGLTLHDAVRYAREVARISGRTA